MGAMTHRVVGAGLVRRGHGATANAAWRRTNRIGLVSPQVARPVETLGTRWRQCR